MTQQNDAKKQDQASTENDKTAKKAGDSASQEDIKKNPGTKTMEHVTKPDKDDNIANPNAAQGSSSDGDTAS